MKYKTFNIVERESLRRIHDTYFHPDSEHDIRFDLLSDLNYSEVISDDEFEMLEKLFERIGDDLWKTIAREDKRLITENFK